MVRFRKGRPLQGVAPEARWARGLESVCVQKKGPHQCSLGGHLGILRGGCTGPAPISCPVFQCSIKISAAYGSTKDISVYSVLGLPPSQIFIVGRPTKKYQTQCQVGGSGGVGPVKAERGEEGGLFRCLFSQPSVRSFAHSFIQHTTGCLCGVQVDSDGPSSGLDGEMERLADRASAVRQQP